MLQFGPSKHCYWQKPINGRARPSIKRRNCPRPSLSLMIMRGVWQSSRRPEKRLKLTLSHVIIGYLKKDKAKCELDAVAEQLILSVEIRYGLAMDSLKNEARKRGLSEYYYQILDILVSPQYVPTWSQNGDEDQNLDSSENGGRLKEADVEGEIGNH